MKRICIIIVAVLSLGICSAAETNSSTQMQAVMSTLNIMQGYPDGNFYEENAVTRAQFAKIAVAASVYKNMVAYNSVTSPFRDVLYTHWAAPYIKVAASNKLVTGYPDSTFLPENPVTLAEAVTVAVKLLGYSEEDFISAWPYGQLGVAKNIGLLDGVQADAGTQLTRGQVMTIIYNTLMTKQKNGGGKYIESLDYKIAEDIIIRATSAESLSVGADKVLTSGGTYYLSEAFSSDWIGRRGDAVISSEDELTLFFPEEQTKEVYNVYSVTGGNLVIMKGNTITNKNLSDAMAVYYDTNGQSETLSSVMSSLELGDVITVMKNARGAVDYGLVFSGEAATKGPVTVNGSGWKTEFGIADDSVVLRDGKSANISDISKNDIVYYSPSINTVWAYSKKITGVYEKANPTKDNVETVVISGTEYEIESAAAMRGLSSGGSFDQGDTVTLLLGKDGKVADVIDPEENNTVITGYLKTVGTKEYTDFNGNRSNTNYAVLVMADGSEMEFNVSNKYDYLRSSIVRVAFENDKTLLRKENSKTDLSGTVSYSSKTIGSKSVADNIAILDVSTTDNSETGDCSSVFLQRIDGLELRTSNVLNYTLNSKGQIETLILKDITGDMHDYGIVKKTPESGGGYICMAGTAEKTLNSGNSTFSVATGQPVQIKMNGNSVKSITTLLALNKKVTNVTTTYIETDDGKYLLSDTVAVYDGTFGGTFQSIPLSDLVTNQGNYKIDAFYDKAEKNGGRIRVLKASK